MGTPLLPVLLAGVWLIGSCAVLYPALALLLIYISVGIPELHMTVGGHVLSMVEVSLFLALLVGLLKRCKVRLQRVHALALVVLSVAVLLFVLPTTTASAPGLAARRLYDIGLACEAFFCGTFLVNTIRRVPALITTILLGAIPICLLTALQSGGFSLPGGIVEVARIFVFTPNETAILSFCLLPFLAVGLACYITSRSWRNQVIGGAITLLITLMLAFAGVRSAVFAGAVMMFVALLFMRYYRLILALLLIMLFMGLFFFHQFTTLVMLTQSLIGHQLTSWSLVVSYILAHPLFGSALRPLPSFSASPVMPILHNQYLELAAEGGITWLLAMLIFLGSIFVVCWRALHSASSQRQQTLLLSTILLLLALAITGFIANPLYATSIDVIVFLQCGMALGSVVQWPKKESKTAAAALALSLQPTPPNAWKTVRAVTFQMVGWAVSGFVMVPATALLTHYLGPVQYGEYGFTLPLLAFGALLSGTGMDPLLIRRLSRQPQARWSRVLSYALGARLLSTLVSMLAIALLALLLPISMEQRTVLWLGCGSLLFSFSYNGLRTVYTYGFRTEQRIAPLVIIETVSRILVAAMIGVAILEHLPFIWTYVLIVYIDLPCFIVLSLIARRRFKMRLQFSRQHIREYILGSLSLTGYDALTLLVGQADVLMLMFILGPFYVGLYALAIRISDPLLSITALYVNGVYPLLCATFEKRRERFADFYREAVRVIALAVIPPSIVVSLLAATAVALLGGEHFVSAVIVVQLLMWATAIICFSQLAARGCMAANLERFIPYISGISALCNIIGNLVMIPRWQAMGAGIVSIASELLALILFTILLRKHIQAWRTLSVVARVGLGTLPAVVILLWQPHISLLITIPIALMLTIGGCYVTRALLWRDMVAIWRFLFIYPVNCYRTAHTGEDAFSEDIDVAESPTLLLPRYDDLAEYPTVIMPRVHM